VIAKSRQPAAADPAVGGEDEEVQPDCEQLAVLVERLPVELEASTGSGT
jgi:hypothetical protein